MADDVLYPTPQRQRSSVSSLSAQSSFERLIASHPPIFENLLLHLPTASLFDLYHSSRSLRDFLRSYPLAWKNLSFRLLHASSSTPPNPAVSGLESPPDTSDFKKPFAIDLLLRNILPFAIRLTRLDLDNTSISGTELYVRVLDPRKATLQHLSVRGCKDVSLKYHILPFLQFHRAQIDGAEPGEPLALSSLYTYRCRHHRRRPYLPSSLNRRDSDSQPTHQLIEICYRLGIWTDTAWCPTPGPRCLRRKDYYISKLGALRETEIWVPFDRLWRSQNIVGPSGVWSDKPNQGCPTARGRRTGRLWEQEEGYAGEALGKSAEDSSYAGKGPPTHLRQSHRAFLEGYRCFTCNDNILERCEQCSVKMHCSGCRKTLCHSCAFDRPVRQKRHRARAVQASGEQRDASIISSDASSTSSAGSTARSRTKSLHRVEPYWWAPGARRSPNRMRESLPTDDLSSDDENLLPVVPHPNPPYPKLEMHWCCIRPCFTGGGGIGLLGTTCGDGIRAAPLPQGQGFECPAFTPSGITPRSTPFFEPATMSRLTTIIGKSSCLAEGEERFKVTFHFLQYLEQPESSGLSDFANVPPRSLCDSCYTSTEWKIPCEACQLPLCIEHDLKRLKVRKCGYRKLEVERQVIQQTKECIHQGHAVPRSVMDANMSHFFAKWRPIVATMHSMDEERRRRGQWTPMNRVTSKGFSIHELRNATPHTGLPASLGPPDVSFTSSQAGSEFSGISGSRNLNIDHTTTTQEDNQQSATRSRSACRVSLVPLPMSKKCDRSLMLTGNYDTAKMQDVQFFAPWSGCGRYFCPANRPPGDYRPQCAGAASVKPCASCGINVCPECTESARRCSCQPCSKNGFMCPNCSNRQDVLSTCKWQEEEDNRIAKEESDRAREAQERARVMKWWAESRESREEADELAIRFEEFFRALEGV